MIGAAVAAARSKSTSHNRKTDAQDSNEEPDLLSVFPAEGSREADLVLGSC